MSDDVADPLRLIALDAEDLAVLSAHLQDAVLNAADLTYLPAEKRFALAARRFDWHGAQGGHKRRRLSALHFERVTAARSTGVSPAVGGRTLNLLAIVFSPTESPAGQITLHFSDGAAVRLDVECIEAQMKDLGPVWEAVATPRHPDDA